ncbi:MAG: hypothetical protein R3F49_24525 [Planctomycetota bacterium]
MARIDAACGAVVEAQRRSGHSLTGLRRLLVDADGRSELELVLAPAYLPDPDGHMELRPPLADAGAPGRRVASSASLVGDWDVGDLRPVRRR